MIVRSIKRANYLDRSLLPVWGGGGQGPCIIESFDLMDIAHSVRGTTAHCYHSEQGTNIALPFVGRGTQVIDGAHQFESRFVYDTVSGWQRNFNYYMVNIGFASTTIQSCKDLLNCYDCKELCITYKE